MSLGKASETGTIEDDDVLTAALDTHTANVAEGDDATFEVDLSGGTSTAAVEVTYEVDASSGDVGNGLHGADELEADDSGGSVERNDHDRHDNDGVLDPGETLVVKLDVRWTTRRRRRRSWNRTRR